MDFHRPLRIAVVSPIEWRTPPRQAGSRELMASVLAEGLSARGHDVTLFATVDSVTQARLCGICPRPLNEDPALDPAVWNLLHLAEVFARSDEFDIIHCHGDMAALGYAGFSEAPVVFTLHETPTARQLPLFHKFAQRASYVAISETSKRQGVPYSATILPGVALDEYRLSSGSRYLLQVGTIAPDRGIEEIIEAAEQTNFPIMVGGLVADGIYFEKVLAPAIAAGKVIYLGPISREQRSEVYGGAVALVHLDKKPQPFRYPYVEAMACGTPIIARDLPGNHEIIDHRRTGFLVSSHEQVVEAILAAGKLDRRKIRQRVLDHFSQNGMVVQYLRVYHAALERARPTQGKLPAGR